LSKSGEKIVKEHLDSIGLKVIKIPEGDSKTVDFEVYQSNRLVCYLEEKTVELTPLAWKGVDPIYESLARHIYEAIKQFKSVNPDNTVANVLSLTNMDPARSIENLYTTLTGYVITHRGKMRPIRNMKRLEKDLDLIDLYLWFDHDQLTGHIYDQNDTASLNDLVETFQLDK